jgi:hypothetical protein
MATRLVQTTLTSPALAVRTSENLLPQPNATSTIGS